MKWHFSTKNCWTKFSWMPLILIRFVLPDAQVLTELLPWKMDHFPLSFHVLFCLKQRGGGREKRFLSCQMWQLSATLMGQNDDTSLHLVSYNLIVINYEKSYNSSTWVQIFLFAGSCFACFIKFCVFHTIQCSSKNNCHSAPTQRQFHAVWRTNIIFTWG